jgi:uncharacterized membrane protein
MRVRIGPTVRLLIGLVFGLMCIMAILQPQRWLFLFRNGFTSTVVLVVLFLLWGLAGKLK